MSKSAPAEPVATSPLLASSAVVIGTARLGDGALLSEGAVIRARASAVQIGTGSAVIENAVVIGTPAMPVVIGRRTTFGHRCLVVGTTVDLHSALSLAQSMRIARPSLGVILVRRRVDTAVLAEALRAG